MPPEKSPGHEAAVRARNGVEEVLFSLAHLPLEFDREGARDRLMRVIERAYAVLDSGPLARSHVDGLSEALAMTGEARALLAAAGDRGEVPGLRAALDRLLAAEAALRAGYAAVAEIQLARRAELYGTEHADVPVIRPFRASNGLPELHAFARRSFVPHVDVGLAEPLPAPLPPPVTIPRPRTLPELDVFRREVASGELARRLLSPSEEEAASVELPDLPELPYEPAVEEAEVLRRLGRSYLEDIAAARTLRKPNPIETWLDQAAFEQRLLNNVDAFASLGGAALPLVSLFHAEAKAPDPGRAFAVALTLGCIEGRDTVGAAIMILKQSAKEELPGWFEGLWLAPNPVLDAAMVDLCTSPREELVALALDVLLARGSTPEEVIDALIDRSEPLIRQRVARALAVVLPQGEAVEELKVIAATAEDGDVFFAAIESLLRRDYEGALRLAREAATNPSWKARRGEALSLLCLAGRASDLELLLEELSRAPTVSLLRGIGRFGHAGALDALVACLHHSDPELVTAAAEALERITGAGLREIVEEPWDVELPPEAARAGGIPVPTRKVERVVVAPDAWEAWMKQHAHGPRADIKLRAGVPFTPLAVVDELEAGGTPPERRVEAWLELALVTGIASPFSPSDWVARQQKHLSELRAEVASLEVVPGVWLSGIAARARDGARAARRERRGGAPTAPETTGDISPAAQRRIREMAEHPLPFEPAREPDKAPAVAEAPEPAPPGRPGPAR